jgi:ParB family transcriptional regulator, chromosome partitioning protein
MARRKRLTAPDAADLAKLEEGFAAKPALDRFGATPPIAQVAAEIAQAAPAADAETRAQQARDAGDAQAWRRAGDEGRLVQLLPLEQIDAEHLVRDRIAVSAEEMDELKASVLAHGVRLPVEVVATKSGFGLISGWRRLAAVRALRGAGHAGMETVPAMVRPGREAAPSYVAMVEENEVRSQLTPYERGRIAVIATAQGAYATVEAAVADIFATASKAKRSKIRSFALVHEELGDLLSYPTGLSEKAGLRLAAALRAGSGSKFRDALAQDHAISARAEWAALDPVLRQFEAHPQERSRGGRPGNAVAATAGEIINLPKGVTMQLTSDARGFALQFRGSAVNRDVMQQVMDTVQNMLRDS